MADLTRADLMLIRQVHEANAEFGMIPFLVAPKWMKRAKALAGRGLLKAGELELLPNPEGWDGFLTTQAGIEAYNEAMNARRADRGVAK